MCRKVSVKQTIPLLNKVRLTPLVKLIIGWGFRARDHVNMRIAQTIISGIPFILGLGTRM